MFYLETRPTQLENANLLNVEEALAEIVAPSGRLKRHERTRVDQVSRMKQLPNLVSSAAPP